MDVLEAVEVQRRRARVDVRLLGAAAALNAAGFLSGLAQLALLARATSGVVELAEANANDARHGAIGVAQTAAFVVAGLAWLRSDAPRLRRPGAARAARARTAAAAVARSAGWFVLAR